MGPFDLLLSPRGRIGRGAYWGFFAAGSALVAAYLIAMNSIIASSIESSLSDRLQASKSSSVFDIDAALASGLIVLVIALPGLMIAAKRWHDIDRSGWWAWLSFAPIIPLVVALCLSSTIGTTAVPGVVWLAAKVVALIAWLIGIVCNGFLAGSTRENRYGPPVRTGAS